MLLCLGGFEIQPPTKNLDLTHTKQGEKKMKEETYKLDNLISDAIDEFKNEYKNYSDINNAISEIASNNTPIYYYDIAQYLANNFILGHTESEFQSKEPFKIIEDNIYNELYNALYNYVNEHKKLSCLL